MSRPVKIIALVLVILVVGATVTGIAFYTAAHDPSNPDPGLYVDGRRVAEPGPALTIGDNEVSFSDFRHYYLVNKALFEAYYGTTLWTDDPYGDNAKILKDSVEQELVSQYAWRQIAQEEGIELSEEDLAEIDATLAEQKESFGTAFEQQLADMYFTDEAQYLETSKQQKLAEKAQTEYNAKLEAELADTVGRQADADYEKDYISAKHILIAFDESETDTEKAEADALEKIEALLEEIRASEDPEATFDELMAANTDDVDADGNPNSPEGYTFKEGDMVTEFYDTALATTEGEISDPVKSTYGYHIILRLPLADTQKESNRAAAVSTAVSEKVNERLEETKAKMPVTYADYYDDIKPDGIV